MARTEKELNNKSLDICIKVFKEALDNFNTFDTIGICLRLFYSCNILDSHREHGYVENYFNNQMPTENKHTSFYNHPNYKKVKRQRTSYWWIEKEQEERRNFVKYLYDRLLTEKHLRQTKDERATYK